MFLHSLISPKLLVLGVGDVCARGLIFIAMVYLFRTVGDANYGRVETALAVLQFAVLAVDQGLGMLGTREIARDPRAAPVWVRRVVSTQVLLSVAVVGLWISVATSAPVDPVLRSLMQGLAFSLLATPFFLPWVYLGLDRVFWVAAPKVLRSGSFVLCTFFLVRGSADVTRLPIAEVGSVMLMALCYVVLYRREVGSLGVSHRWAFDRALLRDGLPIGASQLIWALRMYLPIILIGATAGPAAAGIFGAAHRIIMVFHALFDVYFTRLFPTITRTLSLSAGQFRGMLRHSMHLLLWPSALVAILMTFTSEPIMRMVFGGQHDASESGRVLALLIWLVPLLAWRRHARTALIALGLQRGELVCAFVGVTVLVLLIVPLSRAYQAAGSALAMLVAEFLATLLTWLLLGRRLRSMATSQAETTR